MSQKESRAHDTASTKDLKSGECYNSAARRNAAAIIANSTCVPFTRLDTFICFFCQGKFQEFEKLKAHTATHERDLSHVLDSLKNTNICLEISEMCCVHCDQTFSDIATLKTHLTAHCIKFDPKYEDVGLLPFVLKKTKGLYSCHVCSAKFHSFHVLNNHMNTHFGKYICDDCGAKFVTKSRLRAHLKTHDNSQTHPCDICKKSYSSLKKLKNHIKSVHERKKRAKCLVCSLDFSEYAKKLEHQVSVHGMKTLKFKCDVCGKQYSSKAALTRHDRRDHLHEMNCACDICGKKFFRNTCMKKHRRTHTGERNFECEVCKKKFGQKDILRQHMRLHSGERFVCVRCGAEFVHRAGLNTHVKNHHS